MATVTTSARGRAPLWRGLSKLGQEQVVGVITVLLLSSSRWRCRDSRRRKTSSGLCAASQFSESWAWEWG